MIYITGDTHIPIDIGKLRINKFIQQKTLTSADYLIICGDFGGIWDGSNEDKYWLRWFNEKKFTTLFIDGNHENHQMLNQEYPIVSLCGGNAHKICEKVFHLMRGQVFTLDNKKIFTMGGASSHDKEFRTEGKSWWAEELPSEQEYQNALDNLISCDWKVDYILTHCAPDSVQQKINKNYKEDALTHFLESVMNKTTYNQWFFGHYHIDKQIDNKHTCLYNTILPIL